MDVEVVESPSGVGVDTEMGATPVKNSVKNSVHSSDPRIRHMMRAKYFKCQALRVPWIQNNYDIILWVDGSFQVRDKDLQRAVEQYLSGGVEIACFTHSARRNVAEEVVASQQLQARYTSQNLGGQLQAYEASGFQADQHQLYEMGVFAYRNTPRIQTLMDTWWLHNQIHSYQDQISFPYALSLARKEGMKAPRVISPQIYTRNPLCQFQAHVHREPAPGMATSDTVLDMAATGTASLDSGDVANALGASPRATTSDEHGSTSVHA
jgi:hypothetical protein